MHPFLTRIYAKAKKAKATIILAEAEDPRVVEAAVKIERLGLASLILIGNPDKIEKIAKKQKKFLKSPIIDPRGYGVQLVEKLHLVDKLQHARKHKWMTMVEAKKLIRDPRYFAAMLVKDGMADGFISGNLSPTAETLRPALQIFKGKRAFSFFIMLKNGQPPLFFADCGMNINPDTHELAAIGIGTAQEAALLGVQPRVAFLSYSTHGSGKGESPLKSRKAAAIAAKKLSCVDGEVQFDAAFVPAVAKHKAPTSCLAGKANVFIFPDLESGNIAYKIAERLGGYQALGPLVANAPVHDLSRGCSADDIVAVVALSAAEARR